MIDVISLVPELEEFMLNEHTPFKVVNPNSLPPKTQVAMDEFMNGKSVPHTVYIYSHDYRLFRNLVISGRITIK
ncbi:conserved hypothetical protein [Vibrio crassostreae]|uniref:Uncharacterized protein n=1 Tax=Vibrio kanaloae TaxID=170673 RepID=A0A4U1Z6X6_9VIBR|nr:MULTISPECIES: hypothetical protein [Vibrio]CAK2517789.1 conserved hypothetical protein [Vibrio crassostreae]TKF30123.1 hypothetical protein FCV50_14630 [Vibrio kanaloae]CAK3119578.1 conserved hypothetical protein [Vibrio crassostreae]CAK3639284.1 conserved hypothetical protein [Vibrio crassostreae]CAK3863027.1 conserved hypothetical protein [Vibrio crassostreae]